MTNIKKTLNKNISLNWFEKSLFDLNIHIIFF